jgi:hypothetical protein
VGLTIHTVRIINYGRAAAVDGAFTVGISTSQREGK